MSIELSLSCEENENIFDVVVGDLLDGVGFA